MASLRAPPSLAQAPGTVAAGWPLQCQLDETRLTQPADSPSWCKSIAGGANRSCHE